MNSHPAESAFDEAAKEHVGLALGAIRIVLEALPPREVRLDAYAPAVFPFPHADESRTVSRCQRDVCAIGADPLS